MPRCLQSVRFFHGMLAQGPAGGRRLALMASSSFSRSSVARCCSKVFPRHVVARGSWVLGPVCLLGSPPPCVGPLVVFGPVPCVSSLVPVLGPSGSFERRQWCSDARVAQTSFQTAVAGCDKLLRSSSTSGCEACLSFQSGSFQEIV